jgi:hypothetical protein
VFRRNLLGLPFFAMLSMFQGYFEAFRCLEKTNAQAVTRSVVVVPVETVEDPQRLADGRMSSSFRPPRWSRGNKGAGAGAGYVETCPRSKELKGSWKALTFVSKRCWSSNIGRL